MKKNKTFIEIYQDEKQKPTPAQAFVTEMAKVTQKAEATVKMWLTGRQKPDKLTCEIIAKYFKVKDPSLLFP